MSPFLKSRFKKPLFPEHTPFGQVRLLGFLLGFAIVCGLLTAFLLNTPLVKDWENRFQSKFYLLKSSYSEPEAVNLPLILVLIDDHSLPADTSRSPMDRKWLADLISKIDAHDPVLLGLNILLDRTRDDVGDKKLIDAIKNAGNVILKDDPFYPIYPTFSAVALDKGTLKFKLDSSDTVQEVCANEITCQSKGIFYRKILDYSGFIRGIQAQPSYPDQPWMKINFAVAGRKVNGKTLLSFPVIKAHEVSQLPVGAFKDKIVLVGTGFPDLYPLYRTPLSDPELMLQETEVIAQILGMIAGEGYFSALPILWTGFGLIILLMLISLLLVFRGPLLSLSVSLLFVIFLFVGSGWAFAFHNLEIPFILPLSVLLTFTLAGILAHGLKERFFRMETQIQLKQAKIDFLTNELHSHHLFNEFSRLSVMIKHDPGSAREYLVEFAEMLRSSLKYGDKAMVPVNVQVEYLESYLNQQRLIHKERMQFNFTSNGSFDSLQAPWHAFFPLIENAVKYTEGFLTGSSSKSARIDIELESAGGELVFTIRNPYQDGLEVISARKGLKNLRERLSWAYPRGGYQLDFKHDERLWISRLKIPI
jgi:CHASE2 domain-containing sensor protein